MANKIPFTVLDGITVGDNTVVDASGIWQGPPSNYPGAQGAVGAQGAQGDVGAQGNTGTTGAQGAVGVQGAVGAQGAIGAAGVQGAQGAQGAVGAQGPAGATGPAGVAGTVGAQGRQGFVGPAGAQGRQGTAGATGVPGVLGAQGAQGAAGSSGPTGPAGRQGAQGSQAPEFFANSGAQGAPGATVYSVNSLGVGTPASGTAGEIRASDNIIAYYSDQRLKNIIGPISDPLQRLEKIRGVYYRVNNLAKQHGYQDESVQIGLLAQELQQVLPEVVTPAPFDTDDKGQSVSGENYLTVRYEKVVPLLIEALKQQKSQIDALRLKIQQKAQDER